MPQVFLLSCPRTRQLSRHVLADAGCRDLGQDKRDNQTQPALLNKPKASKYVTKRVLFVVVTQNYHFVTSVRFDHVQRNNQINADNVNSSRRENILYWRNKTVNTWKVKFITYITNM